MFNKKSRKIKELNTLVENLTSDLALERSNNTLWANTLRDFVREKELWDKEAKKWEDRYNLAESQLAGQRDLRTRDWKRPPGGFGTHLDDTEPTAP